MDVTARAGIDFVHQHGPPGSFFMPEIMGPGCALLDYDGDGDLDVYLVNGGLPPGTAPPTEPPGNRLYRQDPGLRFVDVTRASGLGDPGYGMGVAAGDYDNDGDLDVYVTNYGPNALYRNRGDGTFEDVTASARVAGGGWSTSAAFLDFDDDGHLDLYVARYLALDPTVTCPDATGRPDYCNPERFPGLPDILFRNNGDGTFTDWSEKSGIGATRRHGLGVVCADLTGDGRADIYVANDRDPNQLWVNRGDGTFEDRGMELGVALNEAGRAEAGMGVISADLDGDGLLDLLVTNLRGESNTAYRSDGLGGFEDMTARLGLRPISLRFTSFGVVPLDANQDGWLDLAVVSGHVFRGPVEPGASLGEYWNEYAQPGQLFRNEGGRRFADASALAGSFALPFVGRGLASGDVDGDGDLDLLVSATGDRTRLFLNEVPGKGHWLAVRALDPALRRDALGAVVTVHTASRRHVRLVQTAFSYLSSSDPSVHFGLGAEDAVRAIEVTWPGGETERFPGGKADRFVTLRRGGGG